LRKSAEAVGDVHHDLGVVLDEELAGQVVDVHGRRYAWERLAEMRVDFTADWRRSAGALVALLLIGTIGELKSIERNS
jgi:hypothetical protein